MGYNPNNPNGKASSANSAPVVLSNEQQIILESLATASKQDTLNAKDFATQTTLAAVLAKIITAPATEAKQDTLNAKDFATQTTLASILAKLIANPSTEATLLAMNTKVPSQGTAAAAASTPVVQSIESATGNITTQNLVPTGAATAGSAVAINVLGSATVTIGVQGTYTGALSIQATTDGTNWFTITYSALLNAVNGGATAAIASAQTGIFTLHTAAWSAVRVTALAAVTGTANITLKAVNSPSVVAITSPLPAGGNLLGNIVFNSPVQVSDIASTTISSTVTSGTFTPTAGISYVVNIPIIAASGTNQTLDIDVQESDDGGTNWFTVYSFPRMTATGLYRSPILTLRGNRVRYVQTIGGSLPSFTRTINRLQMNVSPINAVSQLIDRSIVLTTLNSVTPSLNVQNAQNLQLVVNIGTATTPPALQLEGSEDNGLTWYAIGTPLTATASSTVQFTLATNINTQFIRARISTIGVTVVAGYVLLKGY